MAVNFIEGALLYAEPWGGSYCCSPRGRRCLTSPRTAAATACTTPHLMWPRSVSGARPVQTATSASLAVTSAGSRLSMSTRETAVMPHSWRWLQRDACSPHVHASARATGAGTTSSGLIPVWAAARESLGPASRSNLPGATSSPPRHGSGHRRMDAAEPMAGRSRRSRLASPNAGVDDDAAMPSASAEAVVHARRAMWRYRASRPVCSKLPSR